MSGKMTPGRFLRENAVILIFILITVLAIKPSGLSLTYIAQELVMRLGRNSFLVLALLLPIYAGMGLNFGMTLGAMAGQIGLIFAINYNVTGVNGLIFAVLLSLPLSVCLGWICGVVLNMAKGREMVTGFILAFFMDGVYQFVVMYCMGPFIPVKNPAILLSRGYGIRNTLNLDIVRQSLDNLLLLKIGPISIPVASFIVVAVLCLFIVWFKKTKLGQDMRAVGHDMHVADSAGVPVNRTRIIAIIISTMFACIGQVIFLQNMGNMNTYNGHTQTAFFAVAAILVGGASVKKATIANVFVGVTLLHALYTVTPNAATKILDQAQIGIFFQQFTGYAVIALALVLYAWRSRQEAERLREGLRQNTTAPVEGGAK